MTRALLVLLLVGLSGGLQASPDGLDGEPYQELRLRVPAESIGALLDLHPDLEVMGLGDGDIRLLSRPSITELLIRAGFDPEILHADLETAYAGRWKDAFDLGPWHSYSETVTELARLHEAYSQIVSEPFSIGRSHQGREIWAIKISDHPEVDEDEPEVLFDGVHHAREIMTVELVLDFARLLCEGYGTDSLVTYLVDHREITLVPIVNPDGFVYNELISPGGGGMWRKNRRVNGNFCYGVDNNRNYPFQWGGHGSSGNACDNTYRGPSPASEPETRAMMDLIRSRRFVTHNSIHSVMGSILIPWCYSVDPTPDDGLFRDIATRMSAANGYIFGQCPEILYYVHGGFVDWAYGEQDEKAKIFSVSTEIGGTGFWPAYAEREGLLAENLPNLLFLTQVAGPSVRVEAIEAPGGETAIEPGSSFSLFARVANDGLLADAGAIRLILRCDDPYLRLLRATAILDPIAPGAAASNDAFPFLLEVEEDCPAGREVPFTLEVRGGGVQSIDLPFTLIVGRARAVYANEFERPGDDWLPDESHTAATGAFVRIVPNATPFQPGEDATFPHGTHAWVTGQNVSEGEEDVDDGIAATRSPDFDLSRMAGARLSMRYFHGQRDGGDDPDGDFFSIAVSPDAGASWVPLVTTGDVATRPIWKSLSVQLEDLIPLTDRVRIRVQVADGAGEGDIIEGGIDDVVLFDTALRSGMPGRPEIDAPADGQGGLSMPVTLRVRNAVDPDGDPLTYGFRIYADDAMTRLVASIDGIPEGADRTAWIVPERLDLGDYLWRAFAEDADQRGLFSPAARFTVADTTGWVPGEDPIGFALTAGPNPSREELRFRCLVPPATMARLEVHDPGGRRIRVLPVDASRSGWLEVAWDGTNDAGRRVAAGTYWVRLWTPRETRTLRVVRLD